MPLDTQGFHVLDILQGHCQATRSSGYKVSMAMVSAALRELTGSKICACKVDDRHVIVGEDRYGIGSEAERKVPHSRHSTCTCCTAVPMYTVQLKSLSRL